ncbi:MAG: exodeoxyribonuclease VII small subunit [Lentisphaeria bacterium]|jgi:exodeoxyribonuclease VII small subunit|nr:exodeoxyribonuclease VII small subunit [Lentisphaeria bacterium]MDY0176089.1 exodeoxyribonuclease VII small subunit [Lentisphaeria bacterium]NLZ60358.1 exodeoxyribonuclease VII small subunit [Lentisphaerota bacterium]
MSEINQELEKLPFDEALRQLEELVAQLESGRLSLEDSIKTFETGMRLNKLCAGKLAEAEKKIELLVKNNQEGWSWQEMPPNSI